MGVGSCGDLEWLMVGWNENEQGARGWRRRLGAAAAGEGEDDGAWRGGGGGYGMGEAERNGLCVRARVFLGSVSVLWVVV